MKGMMPDLWAQQPSKKAEQRIFDREAALALQTEYIEKGVENSILVKIHVLSPLKNKWKGRRHNHEAGKRQPFLLNKHSKLAQKINPFSNITLDITNTPFSISSSLRQEHASRLWFLCRIATFTTWADMGSI